jgi:hypothetical protein
MVFVREKRGLKSLMFSLVGKTLKINKNWLRVKSPASSNKPIMEFKRNGALARPESAGDSVIRGLYVSWGGLTLLHIQTSFCVPSDHSKHRSVHLLTFWNMELLWKTLPTIPCFQNVLKLDSKKLIPEKGFSPMHFEGQGARPAKVYVYHSRPVGWHLPALF